MEDSYADNFSKLALAATSAQLAKTVCVQEYGVGEDLTFNFMGWNGDELIIVCQMKKEMMRMHPNDRLERCSSLLTALRRYWYITAVTMVAEGYCSLDPEKTKGVELAKDFAKQDSAVEECITLTHAEIIDNTIINVNLIALPYIYEIGRNITWLELLTWPTKAEKILRNSEYPKMLENCLRGGVAMDDIPIEAYDELRSTINQNGFYIQELF
jgi:hypothetical protein